MNIQELADLLGTDIKVTYHYNQESRWTCALESVELVDGSCLIAVYADGNTPDEAVFTYCEQVQHSRIKYKDKYYNVPSLSYKSW